MILNTVVANVYTHGTGEIGAKAHGSSAQYGAKVHDEIIGFYSDFPPFLMGKGPPNSLKGLTFANSVAPIWGGQFGGRGRCMPNYWRGVKRIMDTATTRTTLNIGALTENNVEKLFTPASGQFTLTNSNATDLGLKATIYVEGDLLIENDIYNNDTTQFNKFNEIGYIYLIAKGDIFINPNVTRIDAILVAYTDNPITDGRIFTCNFDNQGIDINTKESPDPLINPNIQNRSRDYDQACNQKLIVDGALIGREIHLGRTFCEALTSTCSDPRTDQVGEEIKPVSRILHQYAPATGIQRMALQLRQHNCPANQLLKLKALKEFDNKISS